jgi:hypothetical protein
MNFKKVIFFSAIFCLSWAYSFGSFSDKSSESERDEEPRFEYKTMNIVQLWSRKEVEGAIDVKFVLMPLLLLDLVLFALCTRLELTSFEKVGFFGMGLVINSGYWLDVKRFQYEASQWLQELKEKELASKSKN